LLVALLAIVVLGSAGVIGWLLLKDRGKDEVVVNPKPSPTNTNSITKTPTPNDAENLKEKIANLEKQIQEQKKKTQNVPTINAPTTTTTTPPPPSNKVTAQVNSPSDGFLALRSQPSAETGERILQIPHGASVMVIGCLPKAAGKKARWCRVDYNGHVGWAYDGFLIY
jgi:hypothetical protein